MSKTDGIGGSAEKDVHAEAELAEMLEAVQKRKSEKETMKRRVAWGESKKKDRLRLLSEMEIVEESPERAQFHKYNINPKVACLS